MLARASPCYHLHHVFDIIHIHVYHSTGSIIANDDDSQDCLLHVINESASHRIHRIHSKPGPDLAALRHLEGVELLRAVCRAASHAPRATCVDSGATQAEIEPLLFERGVPAQASLRCSAAPGGGVDLFFSRLGLLRRQAAAARTAGGRARLCTLEKRDPTRRAQGVFEQKTS